MVMSYYVVEIDQCLSEADRLLMRTPRKSIGTVADALQKRCQRILKSLLFALDCLLHLALVLVQLRQERQVIVCVPRLPGGLLAHTDSLDVLLQRLVSDVVLIPTLDFVLFQELTVLHDA